MANISYQGARKEGRYHDQYSALDQAYEKAWEEFLTLKAVVTAEVLNTINASDASEKKQALHKELKTISTELSEEARTALMAAHLQNPDLYNNLISAYDSYVQSAERFGAYVQGDVSPREDNITAFVKDEERGEYFAREKVGEDMNGAPVTAQERATLRKDQVYDNQGLIDELSKVLDFASERHASSLSASAMTVTPSATHAGHDNGALGLNRSVTDRHR